jgi:hypothetical protein
MPHMLELQRKNRVVKVAKIALVYSGPIDQIGTTCEARSFGRSSCTILQEAVKVLVAIGTFASLNALKRPVFWRHPGSHLRPPLL